MTAFAILAMFYFQLRSTLKKTLSMLERPGAGHHISTIGTAALGNGQYSVIWDGMELPLVSGGFS